MSFLAIVLALWVVLLAPPIRWIAALGTARDRARLAAGCAFILAGAMHVVAPERYLPMMPPWLPWPLELVYASGVFEVAGGLGLLIRPLARAASWGLVALLLAVFPANVHAALTGHQAVGLPSDAWYLWLRLPLQGVFIAWVLGTMPRRAARLPGPARAAARRGARASSAFAGRGGA
jgi:uncharacterized membrane protein